MAPRGGSRFGLHGGAYVTGVVQKTCSLAQPREKRSNRSTRDSTARAGWHGRLGRL